MIRTPRTGFLAFVLVALVASGCAAPYKLGPGFYSQSESIKRIGMYPLIYIQDGKEQRLFGAKFHELFYDGVVALPMKPGVTLVKPDSLMADFERQGAVMVDSVFVSGLLGVNFPACRYPEAEHLQKLSGLYDAVIVPTLNKYNEAELGRQMLEYCGSACLTGGMVSVAEDNFINLTFVLLAVPTKELLWTYTYAHSGDLGIQREGYSRNAVKGLAKYFPFSVEFKGK